MLCRDFEKEILNTLFPRDVRHNRPEEPKATNHLLFTNDELETADTSIKKLESCDSIPISEAIKILLEANTDLVRDTFNDILLNNTFPIE